MTLLIAEALLLGGGIKKTLLLGIRSALSWAGRICASGRLWLVRRENAVLRNATTG
jgi:hypothetical protein